MRAFEMYLNEEKLCVAGIGEDGVLDAMVNWVARKEADDLFLHVGGLIGPTEEHVSWIKQKPLRVGDKIQVRVVEASTVDEPKRRRRRDPAKDLKAKKNYVRALAKELGWELQEQTKSKIKTRKKRWGP